MYTETAIVIIMENDFICSLPKKVLLYLHTYRYLSRPSVNCMTLFVNTFIYLFIFWLTQCIHTCIYLKNGQPPHLTHVKVTCHVVLLKFAASEH